MEESKKETLVIDAKCLFYAMRALKDTDADFKDRVISVLELKSYCKRYKWVRRELRSLLKDKDYLIRIAAAEALSVSGAYPREAVRVLWRFLYSTLSLGKTEEMQGWLAIAFLGLKNYGRTAIWTRLTVRRYFYMQKNVYLMVGATDVMSRFAKVLKIDRKFLHHLCKSKIPEVRKRARAILHSKEFSEYMRKK